MLSDKPHFLLAWSLTAFGYNSLRAYLDHKFCKQSLFRLIVLY